MNRSARSIWAMATGVSVSGVNLALGFFVAPYLLGALGAERFGALRTLLDIAAYAALLDFGVSGVLTGMLAPAAASGDRTRLEAAMASGLRAYAKYGVVLVAAGAAFAALAPGLPQFAGIDAREVSLGAALLVIPWLLLPMSAYRLLAEARQQGWLVNSLTGAQAIATLLLQAAAAWAGLGLPGQAAAIAVAQAPTSAILYWVGRTHAPLRAARHAAPLPRVEFGAAFFVQAASRVSLMSDALLVGWVLGPAAVAAFTLTQRMPAMVQAQLQGIGNATWAALIELHAGGQAARVQEKLEELTLTVSSLGIAFLVPLAVANSALVDHWVGPSGWAGGVVSALACVNAWLWSISSLWGWPLGGGGYLRLWAPYAGAALAVNLLVSVAGVFAFGAAGPLLGTTCGMVAVNSWALPRVLRRTMGISPAALARAALAPWTWGMPFAFATWLTWEATRPSGPQAWIQTGLLAVAGLACWWFFGLDGNARHGWIARFMSVAPARQHG